MMLPILTKFTSKLTRNCDFNLSWSRLRKWVSMSSLELWFVYGNDNRQVVRYRTFVDIYFSQTQNI